jgi:hypothetical protein
MGADGGGMAAASAAFWLGLRRALLMRRTREALRATLDASSPVPRPIPLSIVDALNDFPSIRVLLGESILVLVAEAATGVGKWSSSGS